TPGSQLPPCDPPTVGVTPCAGGRARLSRLTEVEPLCGPYRPLREDGLVTRSVGVSAWVHLVDLRAPSGMQRMESMAELTGTLIVHRKRLGEVARVLERNGLATWLERAPGLLDPKTQQKLVDQVAGPDVAELSDAERLRNALVELGPTWVKFGQMLSLRPAGGGAGVGDLFGSFEEEPFASGSVAQVPRATLADGASVAVKVMHDGTVERVHEDLELMAGIAAYLEARDPDLAQLRPTILVDEFTQMMEGAVDLSEELH